MEFQADGSDIALGEATEQDIRVISIIWRNEAGTNGRPVVEVTGMSDWEAATMLKSAARRYQKYCDSLLDCPEIDEEDEEEDDDD